MIEHEDVEGLPGEGLGARGLGGGPADSTHGQGRGGDAGGSAHE